MIVTRANLFYGSWEKRPEDLRFYDINMSPEALKRAAYIIFVEDKVAFIIKSRW